MANCPVCGMTVDESKTEFKMRHGSETYYFCSEGCMNAFGKDPHKFTGEHGHHHSGGCC